jgi:hypothetical protein
MEKNRAVEKIYIRNVIIFLPTLVQLAEKFCINEPTPKRKDFRLAKR